MESLERFYAEAISQERIFLATADALRVTEGLFENLLVANRAGHWRRAEIPWTMGIDAATGAEQPVPLELVHTRYTDPPPIGDGFFQRTTTGLACSMTETGAFIHGLFECIERDAIARAFATHGFFDRRRMATSGLGGGVNRILARAAEHGVSIGLWYAPSPADLPVVWCQSIEAGPCEPILALPTEGYAAGANLEAAATNAMLEALSARPGAISGARDDQTREHYRRRTDELVTSARRIILELPSESQQIDFELATTLSLGELIERIDAAGLGPVVAVPVGSDPETGVQCVRTILPGALPFTVLR
jgi:YcaO-like protein with predicted kinase domain